MAGCYLWSQEHLFPLIGELNMEFPGEVVYLSAQSLFYHQRRLTMKLEVERKVKERPVC